MKTLLFTTLALVISSFFLAPSVFAQTEPPCGNIIAPVSWDNFFNPENNNIETYPISNCANPFNSKPIADYIYQFLIESSVVSEGAIVQVEGGVTDQYVFDTKNKSVSAILFLHDNDNYRYIDTSELEMVEADYRQMANEFFPAGTNIEPFIDAYLSVDPYNYFEEDSELESLLFDFDQYIYINWVYKRPALESGTYTAVFRELLILPTQKTLLQKFVGIFLPSAEAFTGEDVYTVTFTITEEVPEPVGASSVLFLPGIQASKLYKDGLLGIEDQVWTPDALFNNDIYNLSMSTNGISDNNVYTRDVLDRIPNAGTVYEKFSNFMNQLDSENKIESWKPYAYDWRYSVEDVANNGTKYENSIKDAIDEIEELADDSFTDKVTIIGHSNGGLLAKAIMKRLEVEGKSSLIDKVILLASPQLGTPKAIGTILHGYDQTDAIGGIIMDGQIVRKVLNNMPGAYGLLPSEKYFNGLSQPLIVFNDNSSTQPYRNIYGSSISSYGEMVRYVQGEDGLDRSLENPISKPVRANVDLLDQALVEHNDLDNWVAPQGVEVIEIVGTGLPTMKAVEYREITETKCASAGAGGQVCVVEGEIKPYALLTHYGDGTVVQRSAEGYEGEKRKFFVNLDAIENSSLSGEYVHHNITEAPPVMKLLSDLIISTSTENNEFISTNYTTFNDSYDIEVIDSPIRLLSTDSQGNQTGVVVVNGVRTIKEEIPGSQYFEFGDTKYFIVPRGTNRTTKLYGEADGGYTLTTASFGANDTQTVHTVLKNATTTPTMVAEYKNTASQYSNISTDLNGDGTIDTTTSISGVPVVVVSYPLLIAKIQSLSLLKIYKQALLLIINSAQVYANKTTQVTLNKKIERGLLTTAEELIKLYIKKGYLSQVDGQTLLQMITVLKNK